MTVLDLLEKMSKRCTVLVINSDNKTMGEWDYDSIPIQYQVSRVETMQPIGFNKLKVTVYD